MRKGTKTAPARRTARRAARRTARRTTCRAERRERSRKIPVRIGGKAAIWVCTAREIHRAEEHTGRAFEELTDQEFLDAIKEMNLRILGAKDLGQVELTTWRDLESEMGTEVLAELAGEGWEPEDE